MSRCLFLKTRLCLRIPSVHFSYFDPGTRRYQTIESQPIGLVLGPSPHVQRTEIVGGNGSQVATAEQLGRDIVYIKDDPGQLRQRATAWYQSTLFLFWHAVPLALFGAAVWYDRRRQRWYGDVRYARFRQAGKEAQQGLAQAEQVLAGSDSQVFYETLSHTLQEYLAAKLDLPPGRIDADAISGCGVPHDCEQRIHEVLITCEYVRFAPGSGDGDLQSMLAAVQDIVNQLEREQTFPVAVTARAAVKHTCVPETAAGRVDGVYTWNLSYATAVSKNRNSCCSISSRTRVPSGSAKFSPSCPAGSPKPTG